jgi:hypothetical protein
LAFRELFEIAYDITADAAVRASWALVTRGNAGRWVLFGFRLLDGRFSLREGSCSSC